MFLANTGGRRSVLRPEHGCGDPVGVKGYIGVFPMAAAARPYWTGFLKLSLVTIAVRLYTAATEHERIRFHMIHEPTGERVRQQLVVPGTGPVERDEIVKGYEYEKGHYVTVEPDDLKRLRLEDEIRKPDEFFNTIAADAVDEDELAMMQQIIKRKTRSFDPGKFTDHYQTAVRELIEKKLEGKLPEKAPERKQAQVINLMD